MKKLLFVMFVLLCCPTNTEQHLFSHRYRTAQQFFIQAGWPEQVYQQHLATIDFTEPVLITILVQDTPVLRWQKHPRALGSYFAPLDQNHSQLAIYSKDRMKCYYTAQNATTVLISTPKTTIDFWSNPPHTYPVQGGGKQYIAAQPSDFKVQYCIPDSAP